ncbi:MAG: hypothetical protein KBT06_01350 [Prevotellaceae bacterium]|nr:hypothetical protein [Candidatus Colivivens equi]
MKESDIIKLIDNDSMFKDFVSNQDASLEFVINNIPIVIYKEASGTSFYYKVPYDKNYDYDGIVDFMRTAIPELRKKIEEERPTSIMK